MTPICVFEEGFMTVIIGIDPHKATHTAVAVRAQLFGRRGEDAARFLLVQAVVRILGSVALRPRPHVEARNRRSETSGVKEHSGGIACVSSNTCGAIGNAAFWFPVNDLPSLSDLRIAFLDALRFEGKGLWESVWSLERFSPVRGRRCESRARSGTDPPIARRAPDRTERRGVAGQRWSLCDRGGAQSAARSKTCLGSIRNGPAFRFGIIGTTRRHPRRYEQPQRVT